MWPVVPQELHTLASTMHLFPARCWGWNPHDRHSPVGGQQSPVLGVFPVALLRYLSCKGSFLLGVVLAYFVRWRCGSVSSLCRKISSYSSSVVSYSSRALICALRAFSSSVVSRSMRDIHLPIVTSRMGSAYHMALRSHIPESNLSCKASSVYFVTSQRASLAMDRLVRALIWSTASVIFFSAVDAVVVCRLLRGVFPRRPSADCAMV